VQAPAQAIPARRCGGGSSAAATKDGRVNASTRTETVNRLLDDLHAEIHRIRNLPDDSKQQREAVDALARTWIPRLRGCLCELVGDMRLAFAAVREHTEFLIEHSLEGSPADGGRTP
jgi:hypothetical protein